MAKLHIYRKVGGIWSKQADGDGTLSDTKDFDVSITKGSVDKGTAYQIRQGQSVDGDIYDCTVGADKNGTATFHIASVNNTLVMASEQALLVERNYQLAAAAAARSVNIEIDLDDLSTLKTSNYRLCFAKKVGDAAYNVVWQSYIDYLANNTFSWVPEYQLFGSNQFNDNVSVTVSTNVVTIGLGEESTLDNSGILSDPSTGGSTTAFTLVNEYGKIHPGVNQLSTGIDGEQISTPIYVAVDPVVMGNTELKPVEKVLVCFLKDIKTSTMFSSSRSLSVEIDLTSTNSATRLYKDGGWVTP